MATQGEEYIPPETAKYHPIDFKKAMPVVIAILLFGLVSLIFFTNRDSSQGVAEEEKAELPVQTTSTDEFDATLGRQISRNELNRLQEDSVLPQPKVQLPNAQERRSSLQEALLARGGTGGGDTSILQAHRDEELKRALGSNVSGFGATGIVPALSGRAVAAGASPQLSQAQANTAGAKAKLDAAMAQLNGSGASNFDLETAQRVLGGLGGGGFANNSDTDGSSFGSGGNTNLSGTASNRAYPDGYAGSNSTMLATAPFGSKTVMAGTVIPIVLETRVNSDYPGQVKARVARDVFSHDKTSVVIPSGSVVLARSASLSGGSNSAINNRVAVAVPTIIRPDGLKIDLRDLSLLDAAGINGVRGNTNYHIVAQTLATVAYAGLTIFTTDAFVDLLTPDEKEEEPLPVQEDSGPLVAEPRVQVVPVTTTVEETVVDADGNESTITRTTTSQEVIVLEPVIESGGNTETISVQSFEDDTDVAAQVGGAFGVKMAEVFEPLIDKYFSLVPTTTLPAGTRMNLIIEKDIYASPWSKLNNELN